MKRIKQVTSALLLSAAAFAAQYEVITKAVATNYPEIKLTINVRDKATKKPVAGLSKTDFAIHEDLAPISIGNFQEITHKAGSTPVLDIIFVFDETGSMSDEISDLKKKSIEFADIIATSGFDYRIGLISYSDKIEKVFPYNSDAAVFKSQVSKLVASGGGDEPENALDAINKAINDYDHRPDAKKIFILITDASFHSNNSVSSLNANTITERLNAENIELNIVGPHLDQYNWMASNTQGSFFDKNSGQFKKLITNLAGGVSNNYEITYTTKRPSHDNTWRAVEIDLTGKGNAVTQYMSPSWVIASSRRDFWQQEDSKYAPFSVVDGVTSTSWQEGVSGKGEGEWLLFTFDEKLAISSYTITSSANCNKPDQVRLTFDSGKSVISGLGNTTNKQTLTLPAIYNTKSVKVEFLSYHGNSSNSGIAEIEFLNSEGHLIKPILDAHDNNRTLSLAKEINKKGETLYHQKKLDESIFYYKNAINTNPTYAQAYSNLGLAYQKNKQMPEAIAANRMAISLARGETKNVVRASSHYNIARIFESQGKWEQALQNFLWAKSYRSHSAYTKGIDRMNLKLGK